MRSLALAAACAAALALAEARAGELGFVYITSNVGEASGGHAALVADGTVYHLQNADADLLLLVRDGWSAFHLVYAVLENRPLEVAALDVTPEVTERVQRSFARLYVEQQVELAKRESLRDDVRWLEAFARHGATPPLRGAGLVAPGSAGDLDAEWLRAIVHARAGSDSLARLREAAERAVRQLARAGDPTRLESLRESLLLREAARALEGAWGLDPSAAAELPADANEPLSEAERAGLEAWAESQERAVAELVLSSRPDRGHALLLAQARFLAARRSLATNHLVLLDAFDGRAPETLGPEDVADFVRDKRREQAIALFRKGRRSVLASQQIEEANFNLLEEVASIVEREGRADAAGLLSELGMRKVPARGRSLESPPFAGDSALALAGARERLRAQDERLQRRWSYELLTRNCITELARTTDGAFGSEAELVAALGAPSNPGDQTFGFIPFVFFDRVRERLRVTRVAEVPSHRQKELERVFAESPGALTRARESATYTSTTYEPLLRDSAFLLFTDDVFWRRPAYGLVNLAFGLGFTAYGAAALPFDAGARAKAGLEGMMWSLPELAFMNVRKGSYDWVAD